MKHPTTIVIGAGLAGLAAARCLVQEGTPVTVFEKNSYVGGRVHTDVVDSFKIDTGAQFIANFYTNTLNIISELGLRDMVVPISGTTNISRSGQLHEVRTLTGLLLTDLVKFSSKWTFAKVFRSMLLHWRELDIHAFYKAYQLDTISIAEYARRELNDELLAYVLQPPLSGIFYWTPEHTSIVMLFLLLKAGMGIKPLTLSHGLGRLPQAMATGLLVHCDAKVTSVTQEVSGICNVEVDINGQKKQFIADSIVCAVPAMAVPSIFPNLNARQRAFFEAVRYSASVHVAVGLNRRLPSDVYGLFCPGREIKYLGAANVESSRNPGRIPAGQDLIDLFSSSVAGQELLHEDDSVIRDKLWADMQRTGLVHDPNDVQLFHRVYRWQLALPEFDVGHFKRLKVFADGEIETGNVVFAGDYLGGPFIEGAITSGLEAARRLLDRLDRHGSNDQKITR